MKNNEEEQTLMPEFEFDEEEEKRLKSRKFKKRIESNINNFRNSFDWFYNFLLFLFQLYGRKSGRV